MILILQVCIHHFREEDIERNFTINDGTKIVQVPKKKISLKKSAVPCIFPNCPIYLTDTATKPQRHSLEDKEEERMQEVYRRSRKDFEEAEAKFTVNSFNCIISKLHLISLPINWLVHRHDCNTLLFLKIHFQNDVSTIERSVIIDENLLCNAFYKQTNQIGLNYNVVRDIRSLENIFHEVDIFEINQNEQADLSSTSIKYHIENAIHNITSAIDLLEPKNPEFDFEMEKEIMRIRLNFLLDQLKYLIVDKHGRRYTILTQVFCLKVHGISPACYRLIQGSSCLILPHERNLLNIKNSIGLESEYTKIIREVATTFNFLERHVILQMDEVHIRSDASYKGGRVIGSIANSEDPPTTVFSMMVSSLSIKFSTIVRLIPLGSSNAELICPIVKSTICDIEDCGLFVEAVCTDNYPLNVRLYKMFSPDSKLEQKVDHPCDPQRPLILFFDIVHIIKCIRNNWLNHKDNENTLIFPKFEECESCLQNEITINLPKKNFYVSIPTNIISIDHLPISLSILSYAMPHFKISGICINLYLSRTDLYFSFDITVFCYNGKNISAMKALGERI